MSVRCFVGLELPRDVTRSLASLGTAVRATFPAWAGEKWVPVENLHITTCFIGSVDEMAIDALAATLEPACVTSPGCDLFISGLATMPCASRARMLWVSFDDPSGHAEALARAVYGALAPFGVVPEVRAYRAHVTLCRTRRPRRLTPEVLTRVFESAGVSTEPVSLSTATLFASRLTPAGAVYERLAVFQLGRHAGQKRGLGETGGSAETFRGAR